MSNFISSFIKKILSKYSNEFPLYTDLTPEFIDEILENINELLAEPNNLNLPLSTLFLQEIENHFNVYSTILSQYPNEPCNFKFKFK